MMKVITFHEMTNTIKRPNNNNLPFCVCAFKHPKFFLSGTHILSPIIESWWSMLWPRLSPGSKSVCSGLTQPMNKRFTCNSIVFQCSLYIYIYNSIDTHNYHTIAIPNPLLLVYLYPTRILESGHDIIYTYHNTYITYKTSK